MVFWNSYFLLLNDYSKLYPGKALDISIFTTEILLTFPWTRQLII